MRRCQIGRFYRLERRKGTRINIVDMPPYVESQSFAPKTAIAALRSGGSNTGAQCRCTCRHASSRHPLYPPAHRLRPDTPWRSTNTYDSSAMPGAALHDGQHIPLSAHGRSWGPNFGPTYSPAYGANATGASAMTDRRRRGERNRSDWLPGWDEWPRPLQRGPPARPCGSCLAERHAHVDETHVRGPDRRIGAIIDAAMAGGREKLRQSTQDCQEDAHHEGERRSIRCSPNAPSCGSGEPVKPRKEVQRDGRARVVPLCHEPGSALG